MITAPYGFAVFALVYVMLFCVALVAHLVWLWRTAQDIWVWQQPTVLRLMVILAAAVTPVIGFYVSLAIQYVRDPLARQSKANLWTLIMPVVAVCAVLSATGLHELRYTEESRSWASALRFLPGFLAFYVATQLVLHMAARVFRFSRNGPLATRVHVVTCAILLLLIVGK